MKTLTTTVVEVHVSPSELPGALDFYTHAMGKPDKTQYPRLTIFRRSQDDYEVHLIEDDSDFKKQAPFCVNVSLDKVDSIYNHFVTEKHSHSKARSNIKPQSMQMVLHGKSGALELTEIRIASFFLVYAHNGFDSKPVEMEMCVVHNPNM